MSDYTDIKADADRLRWILRCHKEKRVSETQAILWNNSTPSAMRKAIDDAMAKAAPRTAKEGE